ncbi:putative myosin light chain kinase [Apostichopus japonicus]|uniref:Putative myosin light chain kinase n=1 Tax=Stichopus japonicus TaxID=307972 RepID=A0A2G8KUI8_STIJA|nr:putative myosin light chain kinase [Apostichopus japonicus]
MSAATYSSPAVQQDNIEIPAIVGGTARIDCVLTFRTTDVTILWEHDGSPILRSTRVPELTNNLNVKYASMFSNDGTAAWLKISDVTCGDAGKYTCIVFGPVSGKTKTSRILNVQGQLYSHN